MLTLLLGGCAAFQKQAPAAVLPTPDPVACVDPAQIPAEPPMVGQRFNGDAKHDLQVLAPNAKALRDWGQQLRTLLEGCAPKPAATEAKAAAKP
uniref:hypothetical protein n=1 Tax=Altererythrobacter segetis TaxID=1104773 RepID=UPI0014087CF8|nr:hypothetical protein [Altererythrobacter segetis]